MLNISKRESDGVTILSLSGRLVLGDASLFLAKHVKELVAEQTSKILVNIEGVSFIDSCGVGDLIASYSTLKKSGGVLKVCCPVEFVRSVLDVVKMPAIVEVFDTEEEALASFT